MSVKEKIGLLIIGVANTLGFNIMIVLAFRGWFSSHVYLLTVLCFAITSILLYITLYLCEFF